MARQPRIEVPGFPLHVVVRGVDKASCFRDELDFTCFRAWMFAAAAEREVDVHGYVCMTNHVHLMLTGQSAGAISAMMQALGSRYVHWFNDVHERTGALFEGRFRSRLIENDAYALACLRYIDLNPLRAGMVTDPVDYRWSTCATHAIGTVLSGWTPHCTYLALASRDADRRLAYRELLAQPVADEVVRGLRPLGGGGKPLPRSVAVGGSRDSAVAEGSGKSTSGVRYRT